MSAGARVLAGSIAGGAAAVVFLGFAFAYFLSTLMRAVMATLAPSFSSELGLGAGDLGLLAGAYFLGFSLMQLPLGGALDRFGPRRVLQWLLCAAVAGCGAFALADTLPGLIAARMLIGVGVAACLMAPLTCYRRVFGPAAQLRANSWMLMTGSLGMLASTLPVQALLPLIGWRGLFWVLAVLLALSIVIIGLLVPPDPPAPATGPREPDSGYRQIAGHPLFVAAAPLGFFLYGGLLAVQALWAGPWLTRVAGGSAVQAAQGLFLINLGMLVTYMAWGVVMPRLVQRGIGAFSLVAWGVPLSLPLLACILVLGERAGAAWWAAWCMVSTVVTLSQPAVAQAFAAHQAGRALSAFNLVIFVGIFALQWGLGLAIDAAAAAGLGTVDAFRAAFGVFWACCGGAYLWFLRGWRAVAP